MDAIYASAKLTIAALDGDASTGIKGLKSQSSLRILYNIFRWRYGSGAMARHLPALSAQDPEASKYFERSWTYQEYVLSQRRLIFGNQQIHWRCQCANWHEDLPLFDDNADEPRPNVLDFPNINQGWPGFKELGLLLNEYNNRELTYPDDAFPAVNGLLTYLENCSFEQGFLFGLPRAFFDASLMWSCYFGMSTLSRPVRPGLHRRKPSDGRQSILPNAYLPSWSWVGWRGDGISMLDREALFLYSDSSSQSRGKHPASLPEGTVLKIPITQWYSLASVDGTGKRPISSYPTIYKENLTISYDEDAWTVKN